MSTTTAPHVLGNCPNCGNVVYAGLMHHCTTSAMPYITGPRVQDTQPGPILVAKVKDSNPKDAIGTRKLPFSVLPWRVLCHVALAMLEGACKYGRHNYRGVGVRASVYFDACVGRHLTSWWEGEDIDKDSGRHHIDKAIASLMVMRDSMLQGNFVDDRPPRGNVDMELMNAAAAHLIDKHADKSPHHWTIADDNDRR